MSKVRVLLLDDHLLFRQGLARLLGSENDLEVVMHCPAIGEALIAVASGFVDVVILDVDLGAERGIDFLTQARANGFSGPVLVLTAGLSAYEEEMLRRAGIADLLRKDTSLELLASRIRNATGRPQPRPAEAIPAFTDRSPSLSPREIEVLRLVVEGCLNKQIAVEIGCTESTVKSILRQLFHKTGAQNRSQLVRAALEDHLGEM